MAESYQTVAPIIPVIDERLGYSASAPPAHKSKVNQYNDLLEDVYVRELELGNIKARLLDMREVIAQEAAMLKGGIQTLHETSSSEEEHDAADHLSTSGSESGARSVMPFEGSTAKPRNIKAGVKKIKGARGKGSKRSAKIADAELDVGWDYRLEISRGVDMRRFLTDDVALV